MLLHRYSLFNNTGYTMNSSIKWACDCTGSGCTKHAELDNSITETSYYIQGLITMFHHRDVIFYSGTHHYIPSQRRLIIFRDPSLYFHHLQTSYYIQGPITVFLHRDIMLYFHHLQTSYYIQEQCTIFCRRNITILFQIMNLSNPIFSCERSWNPWQINRR